MTDQRTQAFDHFERAIARYSAHLRDELDQAASEAISEYLAGRTAYLYEIADNLTPCYYSEIYLAFSTLVAGDFGHSDCSDVAEDAIRDEGPFDSEIAYMKYCVARAYERALSEHVKALVFEIADLVDVASDLSEAETEEDEDRAIHLAILSAQVHGLDVAKDLENGERDRVLAILSGHLDLYEVFQ